MNFIEKYFDTWADFKADMVERDAEVTLQWRDAGGGRGYLLYFIDDQLRVNLGLSINDPDYSDFINNYKDDANQALKKKWREQAIPKMVNANSDTVGGTAVILLKVPGPVGVGKRKFKGFRVWFNTPVWGDKIRAFITDEDNILGGGAGAVVVDMIDNQAAGPNRGWIIPLTDPILEYEMYEDLFNIRSGLYLKIVGVKKDGSSDNLVVNVNWGRK